jgi:hypothetical protein
MWFLSTASQIPTFHWIYWHTKLYKSTYDCSFGSGVTMLTKTQLIWVHFKRNSLCYWAGGDTKKRKFMSWSCDRVWGLINWIYNQSSGVRIQYHKYRLQCGKTLIKFDPPPILAVYFPKTPKSVTILFLVQYPTSSFQETILPKFCTYSHYYIKYAISGT